ncbi:MAG: NUDIX hydrolase [bacterium]|nr:NUDIX hydrolase [bacterium]
MNYFQPVALAVVQKGNRYLFTLRKDTHADFNNKWQLPGGGVEFGEKPEEAVVREAREELGIEIAIKHLIPLIDTRVRNKWQGIFISYVCEMKNESDRIVLNEEATEWRWFTIEELKNVDVLSGCMEIIEAAQ